jgi:hypothetical protein
MAATARTGAAGIIIMFRAPAEGVLLQETRKAVHATAHTDSLNEIEKWYGFTGPTEWRLNFIVA